VFVLSIWEDRSTAIMQNNATRPRGNGATGVVGKGKPAMVFLNPEKVPPLMNKWQKQLGKDLEEIRIRYMPDGVYVELFGVDGSPYLEYDSDGDVCSITVSRYREQKAEEATPSKKDAIEAYRNRFEIRLNREFPKEINLGDGSETALREATTNLPFHQRRIMLMSNKQFKTAYPNGLGGVVHPAT
jgi:hypothetical protein